MARTRARRQQGGSIRLLKFNRWQVRVLDKSTGRHVSIGTYPTKQDANTALTTAVAEQTRGKWVSPDRGKVTVRDYGRMWIDGHTALAPRTRERYAGLLRRHIEPYLGDARIGDLSTAGVRRWHAQLHKYASPSQAAQAYAFLRAVCATAVADAVLAANPCQVKGAGVEYPEERPTATVSEVTALADAVPDRFRALVLLGAWASLRLASWLRSPDPTWTWCRAL